jgi:S1-C subfamily serine protease
MSNIQINTDAIIKITSIDSVNDPFSPHIDKHAEKSTNSSGTAFFIDSNGLALTCYHVIKNNRESWVNIAKEGKKRIKFNVLNIFPDDDIALIKVDITNNSYLELGDTFNIGDTVQVIGYPLNSDTIIFTSGSISGLKKTYIQTDAVINPGNSGGPLLLKNKVIGISSAKISIKNVEGTGLSTPITHFTNIKLGNEKVIRKPDLLCLFQESQYNNNLPCGITIKKLHNKSPLKINGMKEQDILMEFDNMKLDNWGYVYVPWWKNKLYFIHLLGRYQLDSKIPIKFYNGKENTVTIVLNTSQDNIIKENYNLFEKIKYINIFGYILTNCTFNHISTLKKKNMNVSNMFELVNKFINKESINNVIVTHIMPQSFASSLNIINKGEIIEEINDIPITNIDQIYPLCQNKIIKIKSRDGSIVTIDPLNLQQQYKIKYNKV